MISCHASKIKRYSWYSDGSTVTYNIDMEFDVQQKNLGPIFS